jgi:hypothetical protein
MAQMDIWRSGIKPKFDAQRCTGCVTARKLGGKFGGNEKLVAAALSHTQIVRNLGVFRGAGGRHDTGFIRKIKKMLEKSGLMR